MPGASAASVATGGAAQGGKSDNNQKLADANPELKPAAQADSRSADGKEDSDAKAQKFAKEPWFAKLPPSLRNAIEAKSRGKAPRGYEERLKRYFENVD